MGGYVRINTQLYLNGDPDLKSPLKVGGVYKYCCTIENGRFYDVSYKVGKVAKRSTLVHFSYCDEVGKILYKGE